MREAPAESRCVDVGRREERFIQILSRAAVVVLVGQNVDLRAQGNYKKNQTRPGAVHPRHFTPVVSLEGGIDPAPLTLTSPSSGSILGPIVRVSVRQIV